jgi:DNA-binding response OmpR family regulator
VPKVKPDLVVLDLNMPGEDGLSLAPWLRSDRHCAILMLIAMGSMPDRAVGLETGADDHLAKPFELAELRGLIRAVLRRTMSPVIADGLPPQRDSCSSRAISELCDNCDPATAAATQARAGRRAGCRDRPAQARARSLGPRAFRAITSVTKARSAA